MISEPNFLDKWSEGLGEVTFSKVMLTKTSPSLFNIGFPFKLVAAMWPLQLFHASRGSEHIRAQCTLRIGASIHGVL